MVANLMVITDSSLIAQWWRNTTTMLTNFPERSEQQNRI